MTQAEDDARLGSHPGSRVSMARSISDSAAMSHFEPHVSYLNVLPSRQNLFWSDFAGILHNPKATYEAECTLSPNVSSSWSRALTPLLAPRAPQAGDLSALPSDELSALPEEAGWASEAETLLGLADGPSGDGQLSDREAVFNLANTVLGIGVVSVPYAFRLTGYSSLILVMLVITITTKTGIYLGESLRLADKSPDVVGIPRRARDFAFLAYVSWGDRGRVVIGIVTCLEIWFAFVTFMTMNGVNAAIFMPSCGREPAIVVSCILSSLMVFLPMRVYSYVSLVSTLALVVAVAAMVGAAMMMPSWANPYENLGLPALLQIWNMPRSVGIIVFCFAGHPCFPIVYECMSDKRAWTGAVRTTFLLAFLYYGGLGSFGYLVFGEDLTATFTENIAELEGARFWRNASSLAFMVKIQLSAPLLLNAITVAAFPPPMTGREWPLWRLGALACLTVWTAFIAVAFANDVAVVASITGSGFCMITSVIFPAAVHLRLSHMYGDTMKGDMGAGSSFAGHFAIMAFGASMAIIGTAMAVLDLVRR